MEAPKVKLDFGWWQLSSTITPSTNDLEHIAEMIIGGYAQGELFSDEEEELEELQ